MIRKSHTYLALALLTLTFATGCGHRSRHHAPAIEVAAFLTVANDDHRDIEVLLDGAYVGFVRADEVATFPVFPGTYALDIDVIGDGEPPLAYGSVALFEQEETFVEFRLSLLSLVIDVIFGL